jgi:hydroxymethylpyrimidine pyrophosphatase-like HAD family hydrolase
MPPIRLIGIDLDGTFLTPDGTPSQESLRVLRACKQKGIRVCICTGRSLAQIEGILALEAELDDLCVVTNGASIVNWRTGKYVLERRIDPAMADPLLRALVADCQSVPGRHMSVTGMRQTHMLQSCTRKQFLDAWDGSMVPTRMIHPTLHAFIDACKADIQRIDYSVPFADGERVQALLRTIADLDITSGDPRRLELIPKGINKGEGVNCQFKCNTLQ